MTTQDTQAVVDDTKAQETPAPAVENARNEGEDLDALLAQFEQQTTKTEPVSPPAPQATTDVNSLKAEVESLKGVVNQFSSIKFKTDMAETIKDVRGEIPSDALDDELIEGWLNAKAMANPNLQTAFMQRDAKPQEWKKVKGGLAKELAKKFTNKLDPAATEDRTIVAAAVRGSSTKPPAEPPPNLARMSDEELRKQANDWGFSVPI